jgi:GxxExxY protein
LVRLEVEPQMNTDGRRYAHDDLTRAIIGVFFEVYNELGFGFLESVYREAMSIALRTLGLQVYKEFRLSARFRGQIVGDFKADLIVNGLIIVELKGARALEPVHEAQLLNYLRASVLEIGLLLNFGPKPQLRRSPTPTSARNRPVCSSRPPARSISVDLR